MIQDLFPHLNENYIQVSSIEKKKNYVNNFKVILSSKSRCSSVCRNFSNETIESDCLSMNSSRIFCAIIDTSSSLILPIYKK